ncbi:MAG: AAA family ATPase [Patescibacteria group bacterium]|jgi:cytidylate kinase
MTGKNLRYRNITVSGLPGAGSSTLAKTLAKTLGWDYFSGGDFMRAYAIEQGLFDRNNKLHHDATVYSDDFDRKVDYQTRKSLKEKDHRVIDAWLSGFMAQGIPGTLKILVVCSDDPIRVDRLVNRDNISVADAKKHIFEREQKNLEKWQKMYAKEWQDWVVKAKPSLANEPIYFWNPELYDLVIDTFTLSKEQTLQKALDELGYKEK